MSPRKPRSPGQRQFGPGGQMGSDAEWRRIASTPEVQRMLKDPELAGALYQNFRQTGGQMPQPAQQPSMPMRAGGPARFDSGGESVADLDAEEKAAQDEMRAAQLANDAQARQKAQTKLDQISRKRTAALASAVTSGPVSLGNAQVSGSTMQGLQKLGQKGPPTLGNVAGPALTGALLGGAGTGSGAGALIGGATAGLLSYFLRKNAQNAQKQQQQQNNASPVAGGPTGGVDPNAPAAPSGTRRAMQMQPDGTMKTTTVPYQGQDPPPSAASSSTLPPGPGLYMGTSPSGNVKSADGKSWQTEDGKPLDPGQTVINQTQVKNFDQPSPDLMELPTLSRLPDPQTMASGLGAMDVPSLDDDPGLARGGLAPATAHRPPVPILHTTIVIAAKPKKGAGPVIKAMGPDAPQSGRRPRKPGAIPPAAGPEASGARLPHGRVQVPRGSGAAIKGKRFGGVY